SNFSRFIRTLEDKTNVKGKSLYLPIRIAITGRVCGLELNLVLPILGKKTCLERIKEAINKSHAH
ncbi:glutamate--tRNA ligase, partial [bacterium]|nr:glutamate--tRNA ligase [bacterium]